VKRVIREREETGGKDWSLRTPQKVTATNKKKQPQSHRNDNHGRNNDEDDNAASPPEVMPLRMGHK